MLYHQFPFAFKLTWCMVTTFVIVILGNKVALPTEAHLIL
ncbi:uncharacterized protein METZ01_LOCUS310731 [marine metagenome]|uniref:Uncharacterized protein n=1 Tax=marine metagenome TaxID=408172 RepID=A0A382NC98_9ZZZZ